MDIDYNTIKEAKINKEEILKTFEQMKGLLTHLNDTRSFDKTLSYIDKINEIRDNFLTLYWISYIGYLLNIKDEKYLESEKVMGELEPLMENLKLQYYSYLNSSKYKEDLKPIIGSRVFEIAKNESILLNDSLTNIASKEKELYKKYLRLIVGTKFEFENNEITLSMLNTYMDSDDREMRKKAFDKREEILLSFEEEIDSIYDELIAIRTLAAQNLGFKSYSMVGNIKMNRIGYDQDDIIIFREEVKKHIVPLMKELKDMQEKRLGIEKLMYYDDSYLFSDGNPKIVGDLDVVISSTSEILHSVNKESALLFDKMITNNLIDLSNGENKSSGGVTTYLPNYKTPMFIKKYLGTDDNITTIHHEFGHTQQLYYSRNLKYHENRWPTFDICEIHSTTMEFLMYPYLDKYFKEDVNKYKIKHLTKTLSTIVTKCQVDEFQHFIYDNPNITIQDRKDKWISLNTEYFPYIDYDTEYQAHGIKWQTIASIDNPFYCIDYAIASICALSFYDKMKLDEQSAWNDFINMCKIGGSKSLNEIIEVSNLNNPFVKGSVERVAKTISNDIDLLISIQLNL